MLFYASLLNFHNDYITISASPVEEVGRDHDFDWGLIEPSTSRSIIQSIGRVNRHRQKIIEGANAFVFDKMFKKTQEVTTRRKKAHDIPDFSIFEENCSAKNIFHPKINTQPYKEENALKKDLTNISIFNTLDDTPISQDVTTCNFRDENKQVEYRYDLETLSFKKIDEYAHLVDINIQSSSLENERYSFINEKNFHSILQEYDIHDNRYLKVIHYKDEKDILFFNKFFGVI